MNRRQELAAVIEGVVVDDRAIRPDVIAAAVVSYLARPRDLKPWGLEALGDRAAVTDHEGDLWQRRGDVWCGYEVSDHSSTRLARYGPFRILDAGKVRA